MAQNVTIAGASYSDVPAVDLPKTGGGSARFVDTSDANANKHDLRVGKTAYVNGNKLSFLDHSPLPNGYTEMEYIQNTGGAYINTGVKPTTSAEAYVDFEISGGTNTAYLGLISANNHMHLVHFYWATLDGVAKLYPTIGWYGSQNSYILKTIEKNKRTQMHTFINQSDVLDTNASRYCSAGYADDPETGMIWSATTIVTGTTKYIPPYPFAIFGRYTGSGVAYGTYGKIYRAILWSDGVLARDFIPAMRNSDNVLGLYDVVNNTFYTNNGSGSFTGGTLT